MLQAGEVSDPGLRLPKSTISSYLSVLSQQVVQRTSRLEVAMG